MPCSRRNPLFLVIYKVGDQGRLSGIGLLRSLVIRDCGVRVLPDFCQRVVGVLAVGAIIPLYQYFIMLQAGARKTVRVTVRY